MSDDRRDNIRNVFDGAAESYDAVGVDFFQPIAAGLVAELAPVDGEHALDLGCGRGAVLFRLAKAVGSTGHAVGLDLSPNMAAATAADAAKAGMAVEVIVGDAQDPTVDGGPFDVVASSLVLFFLADPAAAVKSWRNQLKPDGRIGIATFGDLSEAWQRVDAVFAPFLPAEMADPRTQKATSPFGSDGGVEGLLIDAGFNDVRTVNITVRPRFDDAEHWHRWTWSQGQRAMWAMVPEAERPAVLALAFERLEDTRDADGRIGFDQVARFTLGRR